MLSPNENIPAWPGLWGRDEAGFYIVIGRCESCHGTALGLREFCPHCGNRNVLREERGGRTGRLYSATVIHQGPTGFNTPYRVGYVDLDGGVRIFAHIDNGPAAPKIGERVELSVQARMTDRVGQPMTLPVYSAVHRDGGA